MQHIVINIILSIIGAHGIVINSAILSVYIRAWRTGNRLGASDPILLSMALTSLFMVLQLLLRYYLTSFHTQLNTKTALFLIYVLLVLYNMSFCNTAWLSIYYCVKLVTSTHRIFLWMTIWFPSSITKLLLGSAICSVMENLPFFWTIQIKRLQNTNITNGSKSFAVEANVPCSVVNLLLSYILPFTLTLNCIGLSVTSLLHHVWRIRQNVSQDSSSPQLKALVRAAMTMMLRVGLDLTFLIIIMYMFAVSFNISPVTEILFRAFLLSYPSVQSLILIFGNPKIKKSLFRREYTA